MVLRGKIASGVIWIDGVRFIRSPWGTWYGDDKSEYDLPTIERMVRQCTPTSPLS